MGHDSSWAFLLVGIGFFLPVTARADSLTLALSPITQTLPVSTSADFSLLVSGESTDTYSFEFKVLAGPDAGLDVLHFISDVTFDSGILPFSTSFDYLNNGGMGTDQIEAIITSDSTGDVLTSNTVSVDWTAASVPEPSSFLLLATGLAILFVATRRRSLFQKV